MQQKHLGVLLASEFCRGNQRRLIFLSQIQGNQNSLIHDITRSCVTVTSHIFQEHIQQTLNSPRVNRCVKTETVTTSFATIS